MPSAHCLAIDVTLKSSQPRVSLAVCAFVAAGAASKSPPFALHGAPPWVSAQVAPSPVHSPMPLPSRQAVLSLWTPIVTGA